MIVIVVSSSNGSAEYQHNSEDWDNGDDEYQEVPQSDGVYEDGTTIPVHHLPLPYEKIIFVDDEWGLTECLSKLNKVINEIVNR